ncbi:MAG: UxaA family hydrolase [Candidatus Micrarchaeaceae archaeon]
MKFLGYENENGTVGVRSKVLIMSATSVANNVVEKIAENVEGSTPITNPQGRAQYGAEANSNEDFLVNLSQNPNVYSVILVGFDRGKTERIRERMHDKNVRVKSIDIMGHGSLETIRIGSTIALNEVKESTQRRRKEFSLDELVLGVKCGSSDTTSGVLANPVVGRVSDYVCDNGGSVVFGETIEIIGAERYLAERAVSEELREKLLDIVKRVDTTAAELGIKNYLTSSDNIEGGLTTIEEKSLGAIKKSGSRAIVDVIGLGDKVTKRGGVTFLHSPSAGPELLNSLAAAGAVVTIFTTGGGNPAGNPVMPVIKVTGNPETAKAMKDNIDVDISEYLRMNKPIDGAVELVKNELLNVISGKMTSAEILGHNEISVPRKGIWPIV